MGRVRRAEIRDGKEEVPGKGQGRRREYGPLL